MIISFYNFQTCLCFCVIDSVQSGRQDIAAASVFFKQRETTEQEIIYVLVQYEIWPRMSIHCKFQNLNDLHEIIFYAMHVILKEMCE
jgi:hypothetical protein